MILEWLERITAWCTSLLALALALQAWYHTHVCFKSLEQTRARLGRLERGGQPQGQPVPPPKDIPL